MKNLTNNNRKKMSSNQDMEELQDVYFLEAQPKDIRVALSPNVTASQARELAGKLYDCCMMTLFTRSYNLYAKQVTGIDSVEDALRFGAVLFEVLKSTGDRERHLAALSPTDVTLVRLFSHALFNSRIVVESVLMTDPEDDYITTLLDTNNTDAWIRAGAPFFWSHNRRRLMDSIIFHHKQLSQ